MIFTAQNITRVLKGSRDDCIYSEGTKDLPGDFKRKPSRQKCKHEFNV